MKNETRRTPRRPSGPARRTRKPPEIYTLPADRTPTHGELIKHYRTSRGWWQEDLAERLDVTAQTISRYEGGRDLSTEKLRRIAAVLERPVSEFVDPDSQALSAPDEQELLDLYRDLDPRGQEALLHMARAIGPGANKLSS